MDAMRLDSIGRKRWAIAEGYIPSQSSFSDRALVSHETACILNAGDRPARVAITVYFSDREPHHLAASDKCEMRFLVFYAPGAFKTVWADPSKKSAWVSTGRDINDYETAYDQMERRIFAKAFGGPITR